MQERARSLMDLEKQLRRAGTGRSRPRRVPAGAPSPQLGRAAAQAFDLGAPIALRFGEEHMRASPRPFPARPGGTPSLARQRSIFVEAFEEPAEPERAEEVVEEPEPAEEHVEVEDGRKGPAWQEAEEEEEEQAATPAEERGGGGLAGGSGGLSLGKRQKTRTGGQPSPAHAEQIAAFEREVQALSARRPAQAAASTAPPASEPPPEDEDAGAKPPLRTAGHGVFDEMARGMEYANEFRLPPVEVTRLFRDLDQQIDAEKVRRRPEASSAAAAAPPGPIPMPADEELARDLASLEGSKAGGERVLQLVAEQLGTGALRRFPPEAILLGEAEARAVLRFFWPDQDPADLCPLTDTDRSFAQALLIEAADASHAMGIIETLYRTFYGKVAKDFDTIKDMLKTLAKKAIEEKWFSKIETLEDAEKQQIYESVRVTLAAKHSPTYQSRRQTGELTGY